MDIFKNPAETIIRERELRKQNKLMKIKEEKSHRRGNTNYIFSKLNKEDKKSIYR